MRILSGLQPSGPTHEFVISSEVEKSLFCLCRRTKVFGIKLRFFDSAQNDR
jgi:hypothetical protein